MRYKVCGIASLALAAATLLQQQQHVDSFTIPTRRVPVSVLVTRMSRKPDEWMPGGSLNTGNHHEFIRPEAIYPPSSRISNSNKVPAQQRITLNQKKKSSPLGEKKPVMPSAAAGKKIFNPASVQRPTPKPVEINNKMNLTSGKPSSAGKSERKPVMPNNIAPNGRRPGKAVPRPIKNDKQAMPIPLDESFRNIQLEDALKGEQQQQAPRRNQPRQTRAPPQPQTRGKVGNTPAPPQQKKKQVSIKVGDRDFMSGQQPSSFPVTSPKAQKQRKPSEKSIPTANSDNPRFVRYDPKKHGNLMQANPSESLFKGAAPTASPWQELPPGSYSGIGDGKYHRYDRHHENKENYILDSNLNEFVKRTKGPDEGEQATNTESNSAPPPPQQSQQQPQRQQQQQQKQGMIQGQWIDKSVSGLENGDTTTTPPSGEEQRKAPGFVGFSGQDFSQRNPVPAPAPEEYEHILQQQQQQELQRQQQQRRLQDIYPPSEKSPLKQQQYSSKQKSSSDQPKERRRRQMSQPPDAFQEQLPDQSRPFAPFNVDDNDDEPPPPPFAEDDFLMDNPDGGVGEDDFIIMAQDSLETKGDLKVSRQENAILKMEIEELKDRALWKRKEIERLKKELMEAPPDWDPHLSLVDTSQVSLDDYIASETAKNDLRRQREENALLKKEISQLKARTTWKRHEIERLKAKLMEQQSDAGSRQQQQQQSPRQRPPPGFENLQQQQPPMRQQPPPPPFPFDDVDDPMEVRPPVGRIDNDFDGYDDNDDFFAALEEIALPAAERRPAMPRQRGPPMPRNETNDFLGGSERRRRTERRPVMPPSTPKIREGFLDQRTNTTFGRDSRSFSAAEARRPRDEWDGSGSVPPGPEQAARTNFPPRPVSGEPPNSYGPPRWDQSQDARPNGNGRDDQARGSSSGSFPR